MTDNTDTPTPSNPRQETAKLKQMHRHRGELKKEGDSITARPQTLTRLREKGIV